MVHDMDMDLERLIEEIRELSAIPEFKKSIIFKVRELKTLLGKDIEDLRDFDKMLGLREMSKNDFTTKELGALNGQPFQLKRIGNDTWVPSLPGISEKRDVYEAIPAEVVKFITQYGAHVGIPVMQPDLTLPGFRGRKFNLVFEKESDDLFSGVIKEIIPNMSENKIVDRGSFPGISRVKYKLDNLKILNQYLLAYDELYNYYISDFFVRWKPLIDMNIIETNA